MNSALKVLTYGSTDSLIGARRRCRPTRLVSTHRYRRTMMSTEARKFHAMLDRVDMALDWVAALPAEDLTFEERLTLWAQLERLRLTLADAAERCRRAALPLHAG